MYEYEMKDEIYSSSPMICDVYSFGLSPILSLFHSLIQCVYDIFTDYELSMYREEGAQIYMLTLLFIHCQSQSDTLHSHNAMNLCIVHVPYIPHCRLAFSFACRQLFINLMFAGVHIDVGKRKYIIVCTTLLCMYTLYSSGEQQQFLLSQRFNSYFGNFTLDYLASDVVLCFDASTWTELTLVHACKHL